MYEFYLYFFELRWLWWVRDFLFWENESVVRFVLYSLELVFCVILGVLCDIWFYIDCDEWFCRLELFVNL